MQSKLLTRIAVGPQQNRGAAVTAAAAAIADSRTKVIRSVLLHLHTLRLGQPRSGKIFAERNPVGRHYYKVIVAEDFGPARREMGA